ncbi:MAG: CoA-disulfide reductase, partial [Candidatus Omnitrophica bacterium]|nr:CoA-disulfide reductase [Candidatus Omnitrophota bacterium]
DVRNPDEYENEHVDGAMNIPLNYLRSEMAKVPKDRVIYVYCGVGQRAYYATRALRSNGFDARNISGGMQTYHGWSEAERKNS